MMIRIKYPDGKYDMVKASQLDRLIAENRISGFHRATGWVAIGRHPIRSYSRGFYLGAERRGFTEPLLRPGKMLKGSRNGLLSQENKQISYS
jgi:hypothetical protein